MNGMSFRAKCSEVEKSQSLIDQFWFINKRGCLNFRHPLALNKER